jgi:VanZ family protein
LLGLIDESIQATLPYRTASVMDWCFDLLAVLIVVLAKSLPMPWLKLKGIYVSQ